jgi:hypothetical protein
MTFPLNQFGGPDIVLVNDNRLRDALMVIMSKPFPAPEGVDPIRAFAESMATKFPARWPRSDANAAQTFLASLSNGVRLGYLEAKRNVVLLTARADAALAKLDVIRSSCGATMVRGGQEGRPAPAIYCHYCGCLM